MTISTRLPHSASYAVDPTRTRGRFVAEPSPHARSEFQRDRDRIIHSAAFRRLALKTQVFLPEQGDHYRTRLTHTIEVGQITRTLTRALGLDDDLGEALALAHDLGHTPFGHTGEEALEDVLGDYGGFDHNVQTIRIVTLIERRYPRFPGLNLTWDALDGLMRRGGGSSFATMSRWHREGLPCFGDGAWCRGFEATRRASGEAQAAALADDVAYNAHDLEDGLVAGLFGLADLDRVPLLAAVRHALVAADPGIGDDLVIRGLARQLVGLFVEDAIAESRRRLDDLQPRTPEDIRASDRDVVALSPSMAEASRAIKAFLFEHMYRHPLLVEVRGRAKSVLRDLATRFLAAPDLLPAEWREGEAAAVQPARRVADYVAGMTDRFALAEHRRLFDATPELG